MASNAPVKRFRVGYVTASVWKNSGTNSDFYSVTVERSYKDDGGTIQNTGSFNTGDLLNAAKVLGRAEEWISQQ